MRFMLYFLIAFISLKSYAQLGLTKQDVIKKTGCDYMDDNKGFGYFMFYPVTKEFPESCDHCGVIYLFNEDTIATAVLIKRPIEEINDWVKRFNQAQVRVGDMAWRDFEQNIRTEISRQVSHEEMTITISRWHSNNH